MLDRPDSEFVTPSFSAPSPRQDDSRSPVTPAAAPVSSHAGAERHMRTRVPQGDLPLARALAAAVSRRPTPKSPFELGPSLPSRTLQRQEDDGAEADLPLTDAQVAKAISFYKQQPTTYTFLIRLQIQEAVGVEPTASFDAETVQAIARWQRDNGGTPPEQQLPGVTPPPPLKVDGMAGPRTLPRMFASGLNVKAEGLQFGQEAQAGVLDVWRDLTPEQRAAKLVTLVNTHLKKAGVPPVTPVTEETGLDAGSFDFELWQMVIGLKALSEAQPDVKQARDVVDTIYHEARHAEQWFRMAQLRATQLRRGSGKAADDRLVARIVAEMTIPPHIAEKAVKAPLPPGSMQALIAQGWFDSVYGAGRAHRKRTLDELEAAGKALAKARALAKKHPTPANEAALERARIRNREANAAYKNLPEENDAWATGPMTGPGVTSGAPDLPPLPPPTDPELAEIETDLEQLVGAAETL